MCSACRPALCLLLHHAAACFGAGLQDVGAPFGPPACPPGSCSWDCGCGACEGMVAGRWVYWILWLLYRLLMDVGVVWCVWAGQWVMRVRGGAVDGGCTVRACVGAMLWWAPAAALEAFYATASAAALIMALPCALATCGGWGVRHGMPGAEVELGQGALVGCAWRTRARCGRGG